MSQRKGWELGGGKQQDRTCSITTAEKNAKRGLALGGGNLQIPAILITKNYSIRECGHFFVGTHKKRVKDGAGRPSWWIERGNEMAACEKTVLPTQSNQGF